MMLRFPLPFVGVVLLLLGTLQRLTAQPKIIVTDTVFIQAAEKRVNDLELAIKRIVNRDLSVDRRLEAVDYATSLFASPEREFEVSNAHTGKTRTYKVGKYLSRLYHLDYESVQIDWIHIEWARELERGPDGKYHGIIRLIQRFRGEREGYVYQDVTTKTMQVIVDIVTYPTGPNTSKRAVLVTLGDVRVVETRAD